jgi:phenylacetate-coenzyme A ligase PaaK-like adenylate-forming protein
MERERRVRGRFLFLNEYPRTEEWPPGHERRIFSELANHRPPVFEANPSLLARVARWASRSDFEVWQPALIVLTYEFASKLHMRDIRKVFSCPVASSYGSTEAGYVFMECECGLLHQNSESCHVDLLPLPGNSRGCVEPGGLGRIVVTTFENPWSALLRFDIGDVGRRAVASCPCGRVFGLTLSGVEGRLKSVCITGDGRLVTHAQLDNALAYVPGLQQYRVTQDSLSQVRCEVVREPDKGVRLVKDTRGVLTEVFGSRVQLVVSEVPELYAEKSGKFLLVSRSFPLGEAMLGQ